MPDPRDLPFPDFATMAALALIAAGCQHGATFDFDTDIPYFGVTFPGGKCWKVEWAQFDELSERGWIVCDGDELVLTEQGDWQARKFSRKHRLVL